MSAFKTWSDFYTKYGFDLVYDFYTRFSTGEMPIGIASYEMFNTLSVAAQEIRGVGHGACTRDHPGRRYGRHERSRCRQRRRHLQKGGFPG